MHGHDNLKASATMLIVIITHIHVGMYVLRSLKEKSVSINAFERPYVRSSGLGVGLLRSRLLSLKKALLTDMFIFGPPWGV